MKYCPYCGNALDDDMGFCPKCGRAYKSAATSDDNAMEATNKTDIPSVTVDEPEQSKTPAKEVTETAVRKKSKKPIWVIAAAAVVAIVVVCVIFFAPRGNTTPNNDVVMEVSPTATPAESPSIEPTPTSILDDSERLSELSEAVVMIESYNRNGELISTGSGFFAFKDSIVITNYHVIDDGTYSIKLLTESGRYFYAAEVANYDKGKDIAILKINGGSGITPLTLKTGNVNKGEKVIAIGSPLGLINSISEGIVSGFIDDDVKTIQFTAAISNGSSGGALLNEREEVIGITYASWPVLLEMEKLTLVLLLAPQ